MTASPSGPESTTLSYDRSPVSYAGLRDIRATLRILGWVLLASAVSAALLLVALSLGPWPTLAAGIAQGAIAGSICCAAFRRHGVRQIMLATLFAGASGLLGVLMVHTGMRLRDCFRVAVQIEPSWIGAAWDTVQIGHSPSHRYLDAVLAAKSGYGGLLGSILWRASQSERALSMLFFHAIGTIILAGGIGRLLPKTTLCDRCGHRLPATRNAAVIPLAHGRKVYEAVARDDVQGVYELMAQYANAPLGKSCSITKTITCPGCGTIYAWVGYVTEEGDSMHPGLAISSRCMIISREMLDALRSERAEPLAAPVEPSSTPTAPVPSPSDPTTPAPDGSTAP